MTAIPNDREAGGAISLEQLIALNDELVALVRAGLPLEKGLRDAGRDLGGRLGAAAGALSGRLERGEGLVEALGAESGRYPEVYRAVVEAGVRSGRLSAALEGLAGYARGYVETRRAVGLAMIYPAIVLILAYGLLISMLVGVVPQFVSSFESIGPELHWWPLAWLERAGRSVAYWGPILPLALLLVGSFYVMTGRSASLRGGPTSRILGMIPWVGRMLEHSRASNFAEMLALLIEQGLPLDEAVRLAAGTSGDARLKRSSEALSAALRRGESPGEAIQGIAGLPPLVRWLLTTGRDQVGLASGLRGAAQTYRRRSLRQAEVIRNVLPSALLLIVGAGATLFYAMIVFGPIAILLRDLTQD